MAWTAEARERRFPEVQRGWELLGAAVKRRRTAIGWSQRELQRASGLNQSAISRLERGMLSGIRFSTFARLVATMNGLDLDDRIHHGGRLTGRTDRARRSSRIRPGGRGRGPALMRPMVISGRPGADRSRSSDGSPR